jgi:hypothetical protein
VLEDLSKLLSIKTSPFLRSRVYSYLAVFGRYLRIDVPIPKDIELDSSVSVKDSNDAIIQYLRITPRQVERLTLETLRPDASNRRKQRYRENNLGSRNSEQYQRVLKFRRFEYYQAFLAQKEQGITTTQIAKNLGISRGRLYQIIRKEQDD